MELLVLIREELPTSTAQASFNPAPLAAVMVVPIQTATLVDLVVAVERAKTALVVLVDLAVLVKETVVAMLTQRLTKTMEALVVAVLQVVANQDRTLKVVLLVEVALKVLSEVLQPTTLEAAVVPSLVLTTAVAAVAVQAAVAVVSSDLVVVGRQATQEPMV